MVDSGPFSPWFLYEGRQLPHPRMPYFYGPRRAHTDSDSQSIKYFDDPLSAAQHEPAYFEGIGIPRKGSGGNGIGVPHVVGAVLLAVAVAVGIDLAKSETESFLKRNGYWPRGSSRSGRRLTTPPLVQHPNQACQQSVYCRRAQTRTFTRPRRFASSTSMGTDLRRRSLKNLD
jgi:hypothetical protein